MGPETTLKQRIIVTRGPDGRELLARSDGSDPEAEPAPARARPNTEEILQQLQDRAVRDYKAARDAAVKVGRDGLSAPLRGRARGPRAFTRPSMRVPSSCARWGRGGTDPPGALVRQGRERARADVRPWLWSGDRRPGLSALLLLSFCERARPSRVVARGSSRQARPAVSHDHAVARTATPPNARTLAPSRPSAVAMIDDAVCVCAPTPPSRSPPSPPFPPATLPLPRPHAHTNRASRS